MPKNKNPFKSRLRHFEGIFRHIIFHLRSPGYRKNQIEQQYKKFIEKCREDNIKKCCIICSTGGAGTTFMIDYISKYMRTNDRDDRDSFKHPVFPFPPGPPDIAVKYIFLHRNFEDTYNSLYRRGHNFMMAQASKLGARFCVLSDFFLPPDLIMRGPRFFSEFLLRRQKASFKRAVTRQIRHWKKAPHVLMMDYENLWDNIDTIYQYLDLSDPDFIKNFPKNKKLKK